MEKGAPRAPHLVVADPLPCIGLLGDRKVSKHVLSNPLLDVGLDGPQHLLGAMLIEMDLISELRFRIQNQLVQRHEIRASTRGAACHLSTDEGDGVNVGGPDSRVHQEDIFILHFRVRLQDLSQL